MSVLRNLEAKLEGLFEGAFNRAFKSRVQPVEIARKLVKEMQDNQTVSISRTYVPNHYTVWLSPQDREQFEGYEDGLKKELSDYLLEHARNEGLALITRPTIDFETDDRLELGEFGIQTALVGAPEDDEDAAALKAGPSAAGDFGHTMVYSADREARRHAELRNEDGYWTVTDLGSTNGVKVNGRRVQEAVLEPGDELALGLARLRFELE